MRLAYGIVIGLAYGIAIFQLLAGIIVQNAGDVAKSIEQVCQGGCQLQEAALPLPPPPLLLVTRTLTPPLCATTPRVQYKLWTDKDYSAYYATFVFRCGCLQCAGDNTACLGNTARSHALDSVRRLLCPSPSCSYIMVAGFCIIGTVLLLAQTAMGRNSDGGRESASGASEWCI